MSEEEIIEKYHHFKIKTADGIELDLIETKYYKELLALYEQEKEKNSITLSDLLEYKEELTIEKEKNTELRIQISAREQVCEELQKQIEEYKIILKRQEQLEQETENLMKQGWL